MVVISLSNVISLLCGMSMFLFGMSLMGDGLKKVAGSRLEILLGKLTDTPLKGILLGTGVTAVIQSSSATSVMTVGFVNSGMMKFRQAIGIILGAILGTSITGWIICLSDVSGSGWIELISAATITGVVAVIGIVFRLFSKKQSRVNFSFILLGFAVLMLGMSTMSGSVEQLKESRTFIDMLTAFSNPILGILVGAVFTCVLQSASAAVGILQALTATGVITFQVALPLIMGIAIGAAFPVLLSAIGANADGKRTSFVYLFIDILGAVICAVIFYVADLIFDFSFKSMLMDTVSIALLNTVFRFVIVILLAPFISLIERFTCRIIKDDKKDDCEGNKGQILLEDRFLPYPSLAISQCSEVMATMAREALEGYFLAGQALDDYNERYFNKVVSLEDRSDVFEDSLGTYLMRVTRYELNSSQNAEVSKFLHTLSDFERIADHSLDIAKMAKELHEKEISYSKEAISDMNVLREAVDEIVTATVNSFTGNNLISAIKIEPLENVIKELCVQIKTRHIERLQNNSCSLSLSPTFNNLLTDYERVAAHCSNVALAMIESSTDSFNTHKYSSAAENAADDFYAESYKAYSAKFSL